MTHVSKNGYAEREGVIVEGLHSCLTAASAIFAVPLQKIGERLLSGLLLYKLKRLNRYASQCRMTAIAGEGRHPQRKNSEG
jgi:hypothetical protein